MSFEEQSPATLQTTRQQLSYSTDNQTTTQLPLQTTRQQTQLHCRQPDNNSATLHTTRQQLSYSADKANKTSATTTNIILRISHQLLCRQRNQTKTSAITTDIIHKFLRNKLLYITSNQMLAINNDKFTKKKCHFNVQPTSNSPDPFLISQGELFFLNSSHILSHSLSSCPL